MIGLGFASRPFTVTLERLDLHFQARFNGSLSYRPVEVGLNQGADVRCDWFGILELTVGALEIARHDVPDLSCLQVRSHETLPGCIILAPY
jgi:hypothetical protein